jgi:pimeloyl-ACP methyl ester carboxylesterase
MLATVILVLIVAAGTAAVLLWRKRSRMRFPINVLGHGGAKLPVKALVPESKFIEIDGARLHYLQAGRGSDVVLLHGIGASVFIWRFVFAYLETKHRVTAIDLAGFGKSSKDPRRDYGLDAQTSLVAKTLEAIGVSRAHLVGSSMGGAIALWLAKTYPERFSRVATLAPATDPRLAPAAVEHFAMAAPLLRKALNRRLMKAILRRVIARHEVINDDLVTAYLEPFQDRGESLRVFWSAMKLLRDPRLPAGLKGLKAQVLVVYGERDLMVPRKSIDRLLMQLPDAKLLLHKDGGHHIMEDEPEWTARTLEEFFARKIF